MMIMKVILFALVSSLLFAVVHPTNDAMALNVADTIVVVAMYLDWCSLVQFYRSFPLLSYAIRKSMYLKAFADAIPDLDSDPCEIRYQRSRLFKCQGTRGWRFKIDEDKGGYSLMKNDGEYQLSLVSLRKFSKYRYSVLIKEELYLQQSDIEEAIQSTIYSTKVLFPNEMIGWDRDEKSVRDLVRFVVMLIKERLLCEDCPINIAGFSPYNIWLALMFDDSDPRKFDDWENSLLGRKVFGSDEFEHEPARWSRSNNDFHCMVMYGDRYNHPNPEEMILQFTSNAPKIILEVLEEQGLLSQMRDLYQDGTLLSKLNTILVPGWDADASRAIKKRVAEYTAMETDQCMKVFNEWVQSRSDHDKSLQMLWNHWSGSPMFSRTRCQEATLSAVQPEPYYCESWYIISQYCITNLLIPQSLTEEDEEEVANTIYGSLIDDHY